MCFSSPSVPAAPPVVVYPTVATDTVAQDAMTAQRKKNLAMAASWNNTVLNKGGGAGLTTPANTAPKSILGS